MGKFLICVLVATAGAMVAAQQYPHAPYYRGSSYRGLARDITDFGLFKLMSAIQGGGRGHRELLGAASSIRNSLLHPSSSSGPGGHYSPYSGGKDYGYLAPPPRGSKSYYYNPGASSLRGGRPEFMKDTYIIAASGRRPKSKNPYAFSPAAASSGPIEYTSSGAGDYSIPSSSGRPSEYSSSSSVSGSPVYSSPSSSASEYSSPSSSASEYSSPSSASEYSSPSSDSSSIYSSSPSSSASAEYASATSQSSPTPNTITVSSDEPLSLEQIVAKAAQEQHNKVLAREQQAHPGAHVTHNVRLAPQYQQSQPGGPPPQYQQIILQGQHGQIPQQFSTVVPQSYGGPQSQYRHPQQQVLYRGPPQQHFGGPGGPQHQAQGQPILVQGPNGQPMLVLPQGQPQLQYITGGPPGQHGQQIQYVPQHQQQIRGPHHHQQQQPGQPQLIYQQLPQQQGFQFGAPGQQYAAQQIYTLPGPHGYFPQQQPAPEGLLGQPQFTLSPQEQQQIQTNQIYSPQQQQQEQQQQQQEQQQQQSEQSSSGSEQAEQISSAESSISVATVEAPTSSISGDDLMSSSMSEGSDPVTAALLHSHREYSEPVHKM